MAEVEAQVSGFCYQISWFALPKVCAGSVGTDQGKIGGPVGPRECVDCVVGCEFDSCDSWGFAGMGWMVVF